MPKPDVLDDIYYDSAKSRYWKRTHDKRWVIYNQRSISLMLRAAGFSPKISKGESLSNLEREFLRIETENQIDAVGGFAGYKKGMHCIAGQNVLISKSVELPEPVEGGFGLIKELVENLFSPAEEQKDFFYQWLRCSYEHLRDGNITPAQLLAIAGPPGCGKTLIQNLACHILGGRSGRPFSWLSGKTDFNKDLCECEVLILDDESVGSVYQNRLILAKGIKQIAAGSAHRIHGKGENPIAIPIFWRLIMTLNDTPEDLMVLPPMEEGIEDKMIVLKASNGVGKRPYELGVKGYWEILRDQSGAFLHWLLNEYEVPEYVTRGPDSMRYGATSYINPEIAEEVYGLSITDIISPAIEATLFHDKSELQVWEGPTAELYATLTESSAPYAFTVRSQLKSPVALGHQMSELHRRRPQAVERYRTSKDRGWRIHRNFREIPDSDV